MMIWFIRFFSNEVSLYNIQGRLFVQLFKNEGPKALYLGLTPALTRSVLYGGLRLGLYEPSKYVCDLSFGSTNILVKIASGAFAGAIATALTNPVEVLKVSYNFRPSGNLFLNSELTCELSFDFVSGSLADEYKPKPRRTNCRNA